MRFIVISKPKFPVTPEQFPALIQAFVAWRERYRSTTESFEFFAGGGGGFGIFNAPDETTLHQVMMEYPLAMSSELEIRPVINGDKALAMWQAALQVMGGKPPTG